MAERQPDPSELYYILGKLVRLGDTKPSEAIQEIIQSDPQKQDAFLAGAEEGQKAKQDEEA